MKTELPVFSALSARLSVSFVLISQSWSQQPSWEHTASAGS